MADLVTLQTQLTEAESAYHRLLTGSQQEEVEHGDMRLRYTRAMTNDLRGYIESLKTQIATLGGTVTGQRRRAIALDLPGQ